MGEDTPKLLSLLTGHEEGESEGGGVDEARANLTESQLYELVSNSRRREVLDILRREKREVYVREFAECIAAGEEGETVDTVRPSDRRRIETALRQFHLPKMSRMGAIEYDRRRKVVQPKLSPSIYAPYLDLELEGRERRDETLLGTGLLSLAVVIQAQFVSQELAVVLFSGYLLLLAVLCLVRGLPSARGDALLRRWRE